MHGSEHSWQGSSSAKFGFLSVNKIHSFIQMCKSKQTESDKSETVENSNYGLLNISEAGLGTMGLGKILMIILLLIVLGMALM